ncbi:hypothetical protein [Bacillus thuringiensis]|nr:hypothetical protein [Bacillus thuringiensis]
MLEILFSFLKGIAFALGTNSVVFLGKKIEKTTLTTAIVKWLKKIRNRQN